MIVPQTKNGILNIDKPQGITSHDVVDAIRKIFPDQKVGHTGTLDPLATGVLPICIGEATKLSDNLTSEIKKYSVKMLLGVETDTYDITGRIVFASVFNKDEIYIKERIKRFIGKQQQMPPKYSAIKVEGKKLYQQSDDVKIELTGLPVIKDGKDYIVLYDTGEELVNTNDKILTLSSCYTSDGIRVVLHAKLIKREVR